MKIVALGLAACFAFGCTVSQAAKEAALKESSVFSGLKLEAIDGTTLASFYEGKVVLIVNVASRNAGLRLNMKTFRFPTSDSRRGGFALIGVPCNQFGSQSQVLLKRLCRSPSNSTA